MVPQVQQQKKYTHTAKLKLIRGCPSASQVQGTSDESTLSTPEVVSLDTGTCQVVVGKQIHKLRGAKSMG